MQEAVPEGERSDRRIAERITKVEQVVSIIAVAWTRGRFSQQYGLNELRRGETQVCL